jgi:hypothetical protein
MIADKFVANYETELEPYIDSFFQLIIYGFKMLIDSNKFYDSNKIHEEIKKIKGPNAHNALEDYFRNDLVQSYLKKNRHKYDLGDFLINVGTSETYGNIETGFLDIKLQSPKLDDQNTYFIIECKLLDHHSKSQDYYIDHGIKRFVDEKYYPELNSCIAGMLAFIIKPSSTNVTINDVFERIKNKIKFHQVIETIKNLYPFKMLQKKTEYKYIYESIHKRNSGDQIYLIHIFLDYRDIVLWKKLKKI